MTTMKECVSFWRSVLGEVKKAITQNQYDTWFVKTGCRRVDDEGIEIEVPNTFYLEWLNRQYRSTIENAITGVRGTVPPIHFVVTGELDDTTPEAAPETKVVTNTAVQSVQVGEPHMPAISPIRGGDLQLNADYTFDNFVVGPSNRIAHAAALAVVENAGRVYNPLFIHGGIGLGKTHLLQAICHAMLMKRPNLRMMYIPCEQFINRFIAALEKGQVEAFRQRYRMLDVLLIDDIHFLANKDHSQEEFFHTFNTLYNDHKQIILSSDSPPKDIPTLEERLVSRFKWGLVCEIEQPTFETRLAIIRKKSALYEVDIPDEVTEFLAGSLRTNVREIEGAVTRLIGYASIMEKPVTMETAKTALGDLVDARKKRVTIDRIIALVTDHFGVRLSDLQSKKRFQSITLPRQVCMYLARRYTNHSLAEIGGYFGGRDHSTVLYATEKISSRLEHDADLRVSVHEFCRQLDV